MSLINEALKKAQGRETPSGPTRPSGPPVTPHDPPEHGSSKGGHRRFLWIFVLSTLIVGFISILFATFLVYQILEPAPPEETETIATEEATSNPVPVKTEQSQPVATVEEDQPPVTSTEVVAEPRPDLAEVDPVPPPSPETTASTAQPAPVMTPPATSSEPGPPSSTQTQNPSIPPTPVSAVPPNSEVLQRLSQLEIRGIMSGGTKVLIQDLSSGRTKAYTTGETLIGPLGLIIETITPNSIEFRDYAGAIYTKSF